MLLLPPFSHLVYRLAPQKKSVVAKQQTSEEEFYYLRA